MAVKRSVNWLSQQRVDTPMIRSVESAARNDFDELIKSFVTGTIKGYVLRGFTINMAGAIGGASNGLQLVVDPGAIFHINSSQAGTFYLVPPGTPSEQLNSATNAVVDGSFAPGAVNYVGIEFERFIDSSTSSQSYFWNPTQDNETTKTVPQAQVLRYRIKITTSVFAANVLPIAIITTDPGNNVSNIADARDNLFRLATGGVSPDTFHDYSWPQTQIENPSSSNSLDPFYGGDKAISSLKEWMDAIMTSIKEIKGTNYWYGFGAAGSLDGLRADLGNTISTGKGVITHSLTTAGLVNWDEDIYSKVVGSRLSYKFTANPSSSDITLSDNQVAYINLVRDLDVTPNLVFTNSNATVISVGAVSWTTNLLAGDWVKLASDTSAGYYQISTVDSVSQVTLTTNYAGSTTSATGVQALYSFGSYVTSPSPSGNLRAIQIADRASVPQNKDVWWFLFRSDSGGATPHVYVRFIGSELAMGESENINDTVPRQLLEYIGGGITESARYPQYVSAINPGSLPEITDLTCGPASGITSNQYFFINSSANARKYYVWFNKDGTGVDPAPLADHTGVEVDIISADSNTSVATKLANALNTSTTYPDFTAVPTSNVVRVTNNSAGDCVDAVNFNVGGFSVSVFQQGTGFGNFILNDGDNLTLGIKKLDEAYGQILATLDAPSYDEPKDIVGTIVSGTNITLPLNTRLASIQQHYTVGKGSLLLFLNGQYLRLGVDWAEVGSSGVASSQIEILQDLSAPDCLEFRISAGGGAGGGGGQGPQGNPGPQGPPGADAIGSALTISTKNSNYTVLSTDKVLLGDATSASFTFTLPAASANAGRVYMIKKIDSSANIVTVKGNLTEIIDGANTFPLSTQYDVIMIVSDGSQWWIV